VNREGCPEYFDDGERCSTARSETDFKVRRTYNDACRLAELV